MSSSVIKNLIFGPGLLILSVIAALFILARNPRWRMRAAPLQFFTLGLLLAYTTPWLGSWLSAPLVAKAKSLEGNPPESGCQHKFEVIVILGGGIHSEELPSINAQDRLVTAAGLLKQLAETHRHRAVVVTGGPTLATTARAEAEISVPFLKNLLGPIAASEFLYVTETKSRNTYENATLTAAMLDALKLPKDVVLVTSAIHMPRSVATFRKQGYRVCPLNSPWRGSSSWLSFENGSNLYAVLNEWIGAVGYRVRGYSE